MRIKVVRRPSHRKGPKTICVVDGGKGLLAALPFVCPAIPVQGCRAHKMRDRLKEFMLPDILEIVGKSKETAGFKLIPRRRVVARTFARRGRCRQFAGDLERSQESFPGRGAARLLAHLFGKLGQEGDHIVFGFGLNLVDAGDPIRRIRLVAPVPHGLRGFRGDDAGLGQCVAGTGLISNMMRNRFSSAHTAAISGRL